MGKVPVRLREVTYVLSPFEQKVMGGLWKDMGHTLSKKFAYNWLDLTVCAVPVLGTYWYSEWYKEQEKLHHRY